ncbi:Undecaprenyl-phosphate galactosephosphotransferase [Arcticibacter svalbardensis MN12-7]|uniref:Undecaprenyl-phosphate galactosephosphotransferase n=1 Tax=Arcticibacter svalbardensis MN12-7 TaxID=1150600 RepID=R9H186_9SPHI|nr:sugar transferase [Arcticibacter svalbardensis]EOR94994.1 Undecaprenyl-phosphate galactosephosphotransferase [Arcticibacter svalbardensis MN12-7]
MVSLSTLNLSQSGIHARVVYAGSELRDYLSGELSNQFALDSNDLTIKTLEKFLNDQSLLTLPDILLIEADFKGEWINVISNIKKNPLLGGMIIVLLSAFVNKDWRAKAMALKVHDFYSYPFPVEDLCERLQFLVKFRLIKPKLTELSGKVDVRYTLPAYKRTFDIITSGSALLILSPLFAVVAACVLLESKGPAIYKSKRVGTGYKIFDFYKFRSMRTGADKEIAMLSALNQYTDIEKGKSAFIKLKDDPRITKLGKFIRMTSIDELPQLFNVLIGDMSMVGNRPLPLYEAEMLTSNEWTTRFLGPAGLTGLWQISKRGKADMSERERKKLDNFYASNYSFWLDLKILLKTFPALLQKEKV